MRSALHTLTRGRSPNGRDAVRARRRTFTTLAAWLLCAAWGAVLVYALVGTMPSSPLNFTSEARTRYFLLSPQGWSFFTRSPREDAIRAFTLADGKLERATFSHADLRHWMGLRKAARGEARELAVLLARLRPSAWQACDTHVAACLDREEPLPVIRLENTSWVQNYCGRVVAERRPPLPWAWARFRHRTVMPGHVAVLDIQCNDRRSS